MKKEVFKPIPVESPIRNPIKFFLRCLLDLQLLTITRHLKPALRKLKGSVLDVGAGMSPWRGWLSPDASYKGLDVGNADDFGMQAHRESDFVYYDGFVMPFGESEFDAAFCIEVMEHARDPELLLSEVYRVLKPGGTILLTVPWSARRHHIPHDYHRFTKERLLIIFSAAGFVNVRISERGGDISVIANKILVLMVGLVTAMNSHFYIVKLILALMISPACLFFIILAHLSICFNFGSNEDPLGYFVKAERGSN